ncbi:hypothetical protein SAMN05444161_8971 [Rhizobiales bacterium GAS191]|nr:hypothetical protein SAMN05444161_8971 [Rhizobiales bacterium GAS191]
MTLAATVRFIVRHPLSRGQIPQNLGRFAAWQIEARLVPGPVAAQFVGGARLFAVPGLTGASANIYVGLHEFGDMAFVLCALRPEDLFAGEGANIGSFTVLARRPTPHSARQLRLTGPSGRNLTFGALF